MVTDVAAIEGGSISYTTLNATTTNVVTLNVKEDGTIVFEGALDDGFETTLAVVDPTAEQLHFQMKQVQYIHWWNNNTHSNSCCDGGNIGSSDTDAIAMATMVMLHYSKSKS